MPFAEILRDATDDQLREAVRTLLAELNRSLSGGNYTNTSATCYSGPLHDVLTEIKARTAKQ